MALKLQALTEIATDVQALLKNVSELRESGVDDKTDALESEALQAIEKVRKAVELAAEAGSAQKADLQETLQEQLVAIEQRIETDPSLDTSEISKLLHEKAALKGKLALVTFSGALNWDSLLKGNELEQFRKVISPYERLTKGEASDLMTALEWSAEKKRFVLEERSDESRVCRDRLHY